MRTPEQIVATHIESYDEGRNIQIMTRSDLLNAIHFAQREALIMASVVLEVHGAEQRLVKAVLEIEPVKAVLQALDTANCGEPA